MLKRFPFHPIIFAIFPILSLLATNIQEVDPRVALRPILISLAGMTVIFLVWSVILRNWQRAGLITAFIQLLFFTYGHVYELLEKHPVFHINLGRHRYLIIIYAMVFAAGLLLLLWKMKDARTITQFLNIVGIVLLVYPTYRVISYRWNLSISEQKVAEIPVDAATLIPRDPQHLPDIYYIILDTYTRGDALLRDFGFDNSPFLDELRAMGFYVADCSRSNYDYTHASMTSSLNLDYLPVLEEQLSEQGLNTGDIWVLLKQSLVHKQLEAIGYKTVAFESGFEWTRIKDADVYLAYTGKPYAMQLLQPFEDMLIRSTLLLIWSDSTYRSITPYQNTQFKGANPGLEDHVYRQLFILDQLPNVALDSEPKFVFVHILIPHIPYVFEANGDIVTDPGFYTGKRTEPVDEEHLLKGYINEVQFINSQMLSVLKSIISKSNTPPIILLMGDHGLRKENRLLILNAYYLPGNDHSELYLSISPVNSFRVVFNNYFGTHYGLLPDTSIAHGTTEKPETSPECVSP